LPENRHSRPFANASTWNPSSVRSPVPSRRKLKSSPCFHGTEADPARAHTIVAALVLLWCWGTALLVALNDIDFFSLHDLFDTAHPHHEHIVVALGIGGLVASGIIFLWGRRVPVLAA